MVTNISNGIENGLMSLLPQFSEQKHGTWLFEGDCISLMDRLIEKFPAGVFDMIFAAPPYFLSNGGITCYAGRMAIVDRGQWDKSKGVEENHAFNLSWLSRCQKLLKNDGTIWLTGTHHVIYSVGFAIIIWAANYEIMKKMGGGKQMKTVWRIPAPGKEEKLFGKHLTQKPLKLLERIILASTKQQHCIFDPFMGSGTTGVAAIKLGRKFVGCELEKTFFELSILRIKKALEKIHKQRKLPLCV
ncbi:MAG: site-specific DNA-methyltransferase [Candidatus Omnitrophica bacterium]|nr:site-specific DNA-methyltransferase [Candidatus Omnitrophota bacterium]